MPGAYYNEHDPFAAEWLRNLIFFGHIAPGDVDERSIEDVCADDLKGYTQCHFFAGIGVWSYALRQAGWPDDRPVWTGSCPCQPFSSAGKGGGFADERHLWPAFHWLIEQCRPDVVLGEQVASKDGLAWFDLVSSDLEGSGYACGAVDLCAAGFGAPHIRQRNYWCAMADTGSALGQRRPNTEGWAAPGPRQRLESADDDQSCCLVSDVVHTPSEQAGLPGRAWESGGTDDSGLLLHAAGTRFEPEGQEPKDEARDKTRLRGPEQGRATDGGMADDDERRDRGGIGADVARRGEPSDDSILGHHHHHQGLPQRPLATVEPRALRIEGSALGETGLVRGRWAGADWIFCRDGKWRPVESGTFPLAHGAPKRVGRLRGYGNAICAPVAQGFIEAVMDELAEQH